MNHRAILRVTIPAALSLLAVCRAPDWPSFRYRRLTATINIRLALKGTQRDCAHYCHPFLLSTFYP